MSIDEVNEKYSSKSFFSGLLESFVLPRLQASERQRLAYAELEATGKPEFEEAVRVAKQGLEAVVRKRLTREQSDVFDALVLADRYLSAGFLDQEVASLVELAQNDHDAYAVLKFIDAITPDRTRFPTLVF